MSKTRCLIALVSLLVVASAQDFQPLCAGKTACQTSTSIVKISRGVGSCDLSNRATCTATQQAESCFAFKIDKSGNECLEDTREEDASCFATAMAEAHAYVYTAAECDRVGGILCLEAKADAEAIACAMAFAAVEVTIGAGNATSECEIELGKMFDAVATAVSTAASDVCVSDDQPIAWDRRFELSDADQEAFARAFGECFKYCDDEVLAVGADGGVDGSTTETTTGDGCTGPACLGP